MGSSFPALAAPVRKWMAALAAVPTAPLLEHQVLRVVQDGLRGLAGVDWRLDKAGNVHAQYRRGRAARTRGPRFTGVAHLDHPGFAVTEAGEILFRGGVQPEYFPKARIAWYARDHSKAIGRSIIRSLDAADSERWIVEADPLPPSDAVLGMWDLPTIQWDKGLCTSRACDDLIGAATLLALLEWLSREQVAASVDCLFTRAEEVGFYGTLLALDLDPPDRSAPVISIEASKASGFAAFGGGPVLRVGDRSSVFSPSVIRWMEESLQQAGWAGPCQRLLMGGGTCEATPFFQAGYATAGLCLPLLNYHNMGSRRRIAAEAVSLADWNGLFDILQCLASSRAPFPPPATGFSARIEKLRQNARRAILGKIKSA